MLPYNFKTDFPDCKDFRMKCSGRIGEIYIFNKYNFVKEMRNVRILSSLFNQLFQA